MSDSYVTPWAVAHQVPLSLGFPRQEYWSGLLFPSPKDLPKPGTECMSPALAGRFFITEHVCIFYGIYPIGSVLCFSQVDNFQERH